jgi:hypothetical protein
MDKRKPLIRQAGSAEAFVGSTAAGREQLKYKPEVVPCQPRFAGRRALDMGKGLGMLR